jgi:hypothetical protein
LYTQTELSAAVRDTVPGFRKSGNDPFEIADVIGIISGQIGEMHAGTADEIKRILDRERHRLNIREGAIGGLSWTFGYRPRASSRLIAR